MTPCRNKERRIHKDTNFYNMHILMLLDNYYTGDPRVEKEANTLLSFGYNVSIVCFRGSKLEEFQILNGIKIYRILDNNLFQLKRRIYFPDIAKIVNKKFRFSVIHCHDYKMLDLGVQLKKLSRKPLIYDSHELLSGSPIHLLNNSLFHKFKCKLVRNIEVFIEKRNAKQVDAFITVGENIKEILTSNLKISRDKPFEVIQNTPKVKEIVTQSERDRLRDSLGFKKSDFLMVFIGKGFFPQKQNLENLILEMKFADPQLNLVFIGGGENTDYFKKFSKDVGAKRTHFIGNIPPEKSHSYLCAMDLGILPIYNKTDLSYWNALPNKIFDYFMAGLPVLTTNQPEYKKTIDNSQAGVYIHPDLGETFLSAIPTIRQKYEFYKINAKMARTKYNWNFESPKLINLYKNLNKPL